MTISVPLSNVERIIVVQKAYNPGNVAANTTADNGTTLTVTGAAVDDFVIPIKPTNTAGLALLGARVSAADTVTFTFGNLTGAGIDAGSETYTLIFFRRTPGTLPDSIS